MRLLNKNSYKMLINVNYTYNNIIIRLKFAETVYPPYKCIKPY